MAIFRGFFLILDRFFEVLEGFWEGFWEDFSMILGDLFEKLDFVKIGQNHSKTNGFVQFSRCQVLKK